MSARWCSLPLAIVLVAALAHAHKGEKHEPKLERPADAPAGVEYHDHRALHGGVVMMSGDDHAELVAEPGGVYRLWYSDAWRRPIIGGTKATLIVKSPGGEETIVLEPAVDKGELSGKGKAQDGVVRTVVLDGFARGYPFKAQFELRPVVDVKPGVPLAIDVTEAGFVPSDVRVPAGKQVTLRITRRTDATCAKDVVIPGLVEKTALPLHKAVDVSFTAKKAGNIRYGCSMDQMVGGVILVP